jgi:predicted transcriptional regulator
VDVVVDHADVLHECVRLLEAVEELQIRRARELGWSWQQIAELLGVSKQAVHQKYGKGERPKRRRLR